MRTNHHGITIGRVKSTPRILAIALLAAVAAGYWFAGGSRETVGVGVETAASAFDARRSEVWIEDQGTVVALLRDDLEGSRHQRFLVRLAEGGTILVSHNIDLAPRVPLAEGDRVAVRGEYVWNEKGGLVHWTHHDPKGRQPGGWVRHDEQVYR